MDWIGIDGLTNVTVSDYSKWQNTYHVCGKIDGRRWHVHKTIFLSLQAQVPICGWLMVIPLFVPLSGCRG